MANRQIGCTTFLVWLGILMTIGYTSVMYDVVTHAWARGDYGPAVSAGVIVGFVVTVACAVWWVREYGSDFWYARRESWKRRRRGRP